MDYKSSFHCLVILILILFIIIWFSSFNALNGSMIYYPKSASERFQYDNICEVDKFVLNKLQSDDEIKTKHRLHPCLISQNLCIDFVNKTNNSTVQIVSFKKIVKISLRHIKSNKTFRVPNIVHFISFGEGQPFEFYNYISYKSVDKYIKPLGIFLWADNQPNNQWWNRTLAEVPNIYHINTLPIEKIGGKNVSFIAHAADYLRLKLLQEYGGLYFDNDVIIIKSFNDMRVYPLALGRATESSISNGIMVGEPRGRFISIWLEAYETFNPKSWAGNSVFMAHRLAAILPHLIHIEDKSFNHPTWQNLKELYFKRYNIRDNYSIHLYFKLTHYIPRNETELDGYNCTVGDAMRMVLYDSSTLRSNHTVQGYQLKGKKWVQEKFGMS